MSTFWPVTPTITAELVTPPGASASPHQIKLTINSIADYSGNVVRTYQGSSANKWRFELEAGSITPFQVGDLFMTDIPTLYGQGGSVAGKVTSIVSTNVIEAEIIASTPNANNSYTAQLIPTRYGAGYTQPMARIRHSPHPSLFKVEVRYNGGDWTTLFYATNNKVGTTIYHSWLLAGTYEYRLTIQSEWMYPGLRVISNNLNDYFISDTSESTALITVPAYPVPTQYTAVSDLAVSLVSGKPVLTWTAPANVPALCFDIERKYEGEDWQRLTGLQMTPVNNTYTDNTADITKTATYRIRYYTYTVAVYPGVYAPPGGFGIQLSDPLDYNDDGVVDIKDIRDIVAAAMWLSTASLTGLGAVYPAYSLSEYDYGDYSSNPFPGIGRLGRYTSDRAATYSSGDGGAAWRTLAQYYNNRDLSAIKSRSDWSNEATLFAAPFIRYTYFTSGNTIVRAQTNGLGRQVILVSDEPIVALELDRRYGRLYYVTGSGSTWYVRRTGVDGAILSVGAYEDCLTLASAPTGLSLDYESKKLFWAIADTIYKADIDVWTPTGLLTHTDPILTIRYSVDAGKLYYVDDTLELRSCNADGSGDVFLKDLSVDVDSCYDLAANSDYLFIADKLGDEVVRYDIGSGVVTHVAALALESCISVDVDEQSCWIVSEQGVNLYYLYRWDLIAVAAELTQISESNTSTVRFADQGTARPAAPSNLTASRSGSVVTLAWNDSVTGKSNFEVYANTPGAYSEQLLGFTANNQFEHDTNLTLEYRVRAVAAVPPSVTSGWTNPLHALIVDGEYHVNGRSYATLLAWLNTVAAGDEPTPLGPPYTHNSGEPYLDATGNNVVNSADLSAVTAYLADIASEYTDAVTADPPIIDPPVEETGCPSFAWWGTGGAFSTVDLWLGACDDPPSNGQYENAALRFVCNLPVGVIVTEAYIEFTAAGNSGGSNIQLLIAAENNSNASDVTDATEAETSATNLLTATVTWEPTVSWVDEQKYQTPDISAIIQEYIDLPGYAAGNSIMLHILDDNANPDPAPRHVRVEDPCVSSLNPKLVITYVDPDTSTSESSTSEPSTEEPTTVDCHHFWVVARNVITAVDFAALTPDYITVPGYVADDRQFASDAWLDYTNQKLYFTIYFHDAIKAPKGGLLLVLDMATGVYTVIKEWTAAENSPLGLAVDVANDLAYVLQAVSLRAARITTVSLLDATETEIVPSTDISGFGDYRPTHFFVDFTSGYIYTSTLDADDVALTRFDLDGTNKTNLISGLPSVLDIYVSLTDSKIYYGSATVGMIYGGIYQADLDGSDVVKLVEHYNYSLTYDDAAATFYLGYDNGEVFRGYKVGDSIVGLTLVYDPEANFGPSTHTNLFLCGTYGDAPSTGEGSSTEEPTTPEIVGEARYLFWLDHLKDTEAVPYPRLRGTNREPAWVDTILSAPDLNYARCVTGSLKFGRYFWADYRGYVYSCLFDGTDVKLVTDQIPGPYGLAVDEVNDYLFVADFYSGTIVRVNLNNGALVTIASNLTNVLDVTVNIAGTDIYFTAGDKLYATTVNGGGLRTVVDFSNNNVWLYGLDIDSIENELYFVNPAGNSPASYPCLIQKVKTDGTGLTTVVSNIQFATNCVVDATAGHLFWQEPFQNKIRRANLDGTGIISFVAEAGSVYSWLGLLDTPDVTTTEEPPSTEEPTSTPEENSTPEETTPEPPPEEPTTREPDAVGELDQIAVDQHQGGTVYPFIWPSDNLGNLIGDLYLAINDDNYAPPFSIKRLSNFNQDSTSRYEVLVVDANDTVVFDTLLSLPEQFKQYAWTDKRRIIEYADENGQILRIVIYTVQESPVAWDAIIEPTDGRLDPRTIELIPRHVTQLVVRDEDGTLVELPAGTNVAIQGGYNVEIASEQFDTDGSVAGVELTVSADPGSGLGRYPGCEATVYLQTINKVGPDDKGNIRIRFAGPGSSKQNCYWLERPVADIGDNAEVSVEPNTLKLHNNCGPCCKCSDMLNVYQAIRRLYNKYKRLGRRAEIVRDTLRAIHDRWRQSAECRSSTALRATLMPLSNCKMAFGVGLCNNLSDNLKGMRLKIDFTGSSVTGCLRCSSVYRAGNVDPVKNIPRGKPWPYKLSGTWPIFYADFDCIDAAMLATITGQLELTGSTGDTVQVTVSVEGSNPGNAKPVTEKAIMSCEVDSSASCCEASETTTEEIGSARLQISSITSDSNGKRIINLAEPLPFNLPDGHMLTVVATSRNVSNGNFTTIAASAGTRVIVTTEDWDADSVGGYVEL